MRRRFPCILLSIAIIFSVVLNARTVTFIGSGAYNDNGNWLGGMMPLSGVIDTIILSGNVNCNCIIALEQKELLIVKPGFSFTVSSHSESGINFMGAAVKVETGATFNFWTYNKFSVGKLYVDGLLNASWMGNEGTDSVIVNGTFNFEGFFGEVSKVVVNDGGLFKVAKNALLTGRSITINSGGTFISEGIFYNNLPFLVKSGGTLHNKKDGSFNNESTLIVNTGGIFINDGNFVGNGTFAIGNFANGGILAPGNSPGIISLTGDYSPTSTATHNFEISGTASNQYDILNVSGAVNLNGTLNISLINGFTPSTNHELPIITGAINGTFSTVNIPTSYILVYNANSVVLKSAIVLPVSFKSIDVKKSNNKVKINWSVEDENDVLRYEVERSYDGRTFINVGSVPANNQKIYSYDDAINGGKVFYRIRSINNDRTIKFSAIANYNNGISSTQLKTFTLSNKLFIQHTTASKNSKLSVLSIDGRQLKAIVPKQGWQQTEIDISNLSRGVYIIKFNNTGSSESIKFIKQ